MVNTMEKHYMIDIETTGVNKETDDILEVALIELSYEYPYWYPTSKVFHRVLHSKRTPQDSFAKEHMSELYKKCNEQDENEDYNKLCTDLTMFLHNGADQGDPKFFMGWNASNFDIPFIFKKNILTPSYYEDTEDGQKLLGDVHYRIYEQTGALNLASNVSGFSRKLVKKLAEELNPTDVILPEGKSHDALYDCYWQLILMNGLIEITRKGFKV